MAAEFAVVPRPDLNLIEITMSGFFQPADIADFEAARNDAHRQLTCEPNQHLTLVDIRRMQIQSQDAVAGFRAILTNPAYASKRIAIVVTQSLARMQIRRAADGRDVEYFTDDVALARAWVLAD